MTKKESKKCKECKESDEDCKCPKKGKKGYYGLDLRYGRDGMDHDNPMEDGGESSSMGEGVVARTSMSGREKRKTLDDFKTAASDAQKRQSDKDTKDKLAVERMRKGVRFFDKKGSGYMKGGKKVYD